MYRCQTAPGSITSLTSLGVSQNIGFNHLLDNSKITGLQASERVQVYATVKLY